MAGSIAPHNEKSASVWDSGGANYDAISRGIADSIEHCVLRLNPQPGEKILDLATGTGWTSRVVAGRGATVTGVDIGPHLVEAAAEKARREGLDIAYEIGDAEALPFGDGEFDVVCSVNVLSHIHPDSEWVFSELARVATSGLVLVEDEHSRSMWDFPRNYRRIFEGFGMAQLHEEACPAKDGAAESMLRVFSRQVAR